MADQLLNILPEAFRTAAQTNRPLQALAAAAVDMHAPAHRVLADLRGYFDPYRAPESMLPYLAQWVDLDWLVNSTVGAAARVGSAPEQERLRDLVANAAELSARRGTVEGLKRFLHLAIGVPGFTIDDVPGAFHLNVGVPAAAASHLLLVRRIVEGTKPAHTTCSIDVIAAVPEPEEAEP
jgi:phage tail-like protein